MRKKIGFVGGGQLCRMIGEDIRSKNLPFELIALDPTPKCPAYPFLSEQIIGGFKDENKIRELAEKSDILTYEIELANSKILDELQKNKPVHPSPETLKIIQDKYIQASFLKNNNIPVPDFMKICDETDLIEAINTFGLPLMIKARIDSYDGRGNFVLIEKGQIEGIIEMFKERSLMAQKYIHYDAEISVIATRNIKGEISTFPVGENIHGKDYNILRTTIVPARIKPDLEVKAKQVAEITMNTLKGAGVFGIEMLVKGEDILINEIAPRVHNSGHYTIEACKTSQFEQHLRAIAGMDLGDTRLNSIAIMHNIIGEKNYGGGYNISYLSKDITGVCEIEEGIYVHNYGKHEVKPYRKIGHITLLGGKKESMEELTIRAFSIKDLVKILPNNKLME